MTTLKEIADLFRLYVDEIAKVRADQIEQHPYLPEAQEAADQLEALAGAEPVAWRWRTKSSTPCDRDWTNWLSLPAPGPQKIGPMQEVECAYAAPQRITISRKSLRDALDPADAYTENGRGIPAYTIGSVMAALCALGIDVRDEG